MKTKKGTNKFCKIKNLRNESDVEQFLILPLLKDMVGPNVWTTKLKK